jgi:hypothetical protein
MGQQYSKLLGQYNENDMVLKELNMLEDDSTVYKLVGRRGALQRWKASAVHRRRNVAFSTPYVPSDVPPGKISVIVLFN